MKAVRCFVILFDNVSLNDSTVENVTSSTACLNGRIGRSSSRYRLGEVLCAFYPAWEEFEGADVSDDVVLPLRVSLRLTADAAAASRPYPCTRPRTHNGPIAHQTDGKRYWFGIAGG